MSYFMMGGAALGALTNKKHPLKGALMGAGMGYAAPLAAGALGAGGAEGAGLLGSQAAAPVSEAAFSAGAGGSTAGLGAGVPGEAGGLLGAFNKVSPYMNAAKTGMDMAGSFNAMSGPSAQSPGAAQIQTQNPEFSGLLSGMQSQDAQRMQEEMQRRQRRAQLMGGL